MFFWRVEAKVRFTFKWSLRCVLWKVDWKGKSGKQGAEETDLQVYERWWMPQLGRRPQVKLPGT